MFGVGVIIAAVVAGTGASAPTLQPDGCVRLLAPLAAGAVPVTGDFASAPCPAAGKPAFRYDRIDRRIRAARALAAGEIVAAPPPVLMAAVRPGDRLRLIVRVGPVKVERQVTAVQTGRPGGAVFVRSDEGAVFAAPMEALSP